MVETYGGRSSAQDNHLLRSLKHELAAFDGMLTLVEMRQGHVLVQPNEPVPHVHFPLLGMISMVAVMEEGDTAEVNVVGREGGHGMRAVLADRPSYVQAVVQIEGRALRIGADDFRQAVGRSPALRNAIDRFEHALLIQAQQTAACNLLHNVQRRLARWILACLDRIDGDELLLTQELLGQMLGVRRTTVTDIAQALQTRGFFRYSRGRITVLDRDGLEEIACECRQVSKHHLDALWTEGPR